MKTTEKSYLERLGSTAQVLSVVVGVVISVLSFNATRIKEAEALRQQADAQRLRAEALRREAVRPFLELRQEMYTEAVKAAAILTNPESHTEEELSTAKKRFRELYVAELSMVESPVVEGKMKALAEVIDPPLIPLTSAQRAAYELAHALRDTFISSWGIEDR